MHRALQQRFLMKSHQLFRLAEAAGSTGGKDHSRNVLHYALRAHCVCK